MQISSFDGGNIQIKMSKAILDAIIEERENITVLIDGVKTEFTEIPSNVTDQQQQLPQKDTIREISVFIPKGDKKVEMIEKDFPKFLYQCFLITIINDTTAIIGIAIASIILTIIPKLYFPSGGRGNGFNILGGA